MKFTMYKKETDDRKYRDNLYRSVNFRIDENGIMYCLNEKAFVFRYRRPVKGNRYGRQEEIYECENCSECPYV